MRRHYGLWTTALIAPFLLTLPAQTHAQTTGTEQAQTRGVWLQVEAMPTLGQAQDRVRAYAARLPDVAGFDLGNGWYGIVLGPYTPQDAEAALRRLRALGDIPADSYVTTGSSFTRQYWPIGARGDLAPRPLPQTLGGTDAPPVPAPPPVVTGDPMLDALAADLAATLAEAMDNAPADETAPGASLPETDLTEGLSDTQTALPDTYTDALTETEADIALPDLAPQEGTALPEVTFPNALTPDESESEAYASESALSRAQKEQLQVALQWAGFYEGAIDGAFGRGTRSAMRAWQSAQGHAATGVLTTRERATLLGAYNAVLTETGLALVTDPEAGIEVIMPTAAVAHSETTPPFVLYDATGAVPGAQVILLSQQGDARRLAALYEMVQSLENVPATSERSLTATGFSINGGDGRVQSYAHATLAGGEIKGFILVWPAGDDRFTRLWNEMRASFRTIPGVLPTPAVAQADLAALDMSAGLALRKPQRVGAGVFVNATGAVVTDAALVEQCAKVEIAGGHPASISHSDGAIAVLTPQDRMAPPLVARFTERAPQSGERLAVAGYPYGGALLTPTLTFGTAAARGGLQGESDQMRLALDGAEGDLGGPVLDATGAVVGLFTLPDLPAGQVLPADVSFLRDAAIVMAGLRAAGVGFETAGDSAALPDPTLTRRAGEMVVQVACW